MPESLTIALVVVLALAIGCAVAVRRARRLQERQRSLERDLDAVQAALVPRVPARLEGLWVSVGYRPAEGPAAGGDFYDLFSPGPDRVAIILGDVAGHGPRALTQAALTRYTVRAYLQAGLEPRRALALAGEALVDPSGAHYATVAVALFDRFHGTLTYALAGHPPPLLCGERGREHRTVTACSSPPIGSGLPTGRRQTTVTLPRGAAACFFSDGLVEAHARGQRFGRERLREILAELGPRPEAARVLERVRAAGRAGHDDMVACVLAPELTGGGAARHTEQLELGAGEVERLHVARFLEECGVPGWEIALALERVEDLAAGDETALLSVELGAGTGTGTGAPTA
ncbi:MAG: serine/threonine-protein phosphatase, partial [Solirubrobacterales bacterium]|nr:serine/threonine-protein phosphatase [Solirubrobacterales bacterium]